MIRAILFDKDGTLTDFRATWDSWLGTTLRALSAESGASVDALAEALGYDVAAARMRADGRFVTATSRASAEALAAAAGWTPDATSRWWEDRAAGVAQVPVGEAGTLFAQLRRRGLKLGVLTNDERASALLHLDALAVTHLLDAVVASDDGHGPKPEPAGALAFARAVDVAPGEVLVVGDGLTDRDAAREAGMPFVAVLTGTLPGEAYDGALAVLDDVTALPAWLDAQGAGVLALTRS